MPDELLASLVAVLGGAVLAVATLAGAYLLRRIHEHGDRILRLELDVSRLRMVEEDALLRGRVRGRNRAKEGA
ncbi:MAG: hypothetical protein ABR562_08460 [Thermoplasmatota archaeon]|nr:hypothetical protein [Halobacteriales archaeon]